MQPTQENYDALAKIFQAGKTGDSDGWEDLAIDPDYMSDENLPTATRETLDDWRAASRHWNETCPCQEIDGGLFWDRVQVLKGQQRVSIAVIDCGDFRLVYNQ